MKNNIYKIALIVSVILIAIFAFSGIFNNPSTDNIIDEEFFTVEVQVLDNELLRYPFGSINNETLEELLDEAVEYGMFVYEKETASFGSFIISINGIEADPNSSFWAIKINGEDSMVGISEINPNDNDIITFTLTNF